MKTFMALATVAVVVAAALGADQPLCWPQFRGPGGAGLAQGQKPPVQFGPEKNLRWKVAVPGGFLSEEIMELLAQRQLAQDSHHCPHGRPTSLRFSRRDLERHFKRV
jgi:hypothetical protein